MNLYISLDEIKNQLSAGRHGQSLNDNENVRILLCQIFIYMGGGGRRKM